MRSHLIALLSVVPLGQIHREERDVMVEVPASMLAHERTPVHRNQLLTLERNGIWARVRLLQGERLVMAMSAPANESID